MKNVFLRNDYTSEVVYKVLRSLRILTSRKSVLNRESIHKGEGYFGVCAGNGIASVRVRRKSLAKER